MESESQKNTSQLKLSLLEAVIARHWEMVGDGGAFEQQLEIEAERLGAGKTSLIEACRELSEVWSSKMEKNQRVHPDADRLEPLLSAKEVARLFGAPVATIRIWVGEGRLPAVRIGRNYRFHPGTIRRILIGGGQ